MTRKPQQYIEPKIFITINKNVFGINYKGNWYGLHRDYSQSYGKLEFVWWWHKDKKILAIIILGLWFGLRFEGR